MMGYDIGSPEWFLHAPAWGLNGVVSTILRLLEQRVISRRKAHDLLWRYWEEVGDRGRVWLDSREQPGGFRQFVTEELQAPWHDLNWEWETDVGG
jgi:hypothetical protein